MEPKSFTYERQRAELAEAKARIAELEAAGNRLGDAAIAGILDSRDRAERAEAERDRERLMRKLYEDAAKHWQPRADRAEAERDAMRETVRKIRATDNITAVWHIADAALNPPD